MKLLAIETATDACSAALWVDEEILSRFEIAPREHARLILPMVDSLLEEAGFSIGQVDAIAFSRGPGAFTGLRIAAGVTQGIALAAELPVVPVSTLAAMAQQVMDERAISHILPSLDARMSEVYWAAYVRDAAGYAELMGTEVVTAPQAVPLPEAAQWFGVGSGWRTYSEVLARRLGSRVTGHDSELVPHAREVARLGARDFSDGHAVSAEQAQPVYLRDKVAEKPKAPAKGL